MTSAANVRAAVVATSLAVAVALATPAMASAAKPRGAVAALAAGECVREKAAIGKRAFRKRYAAKRPMAACVKARMPEARRATEVATALCQSELDEWGLEEFLVDWESFEDCVLTYSEWEMDGGIEEVEEVDDPGDELAG